MCSPDIVFSTAMHPQLPEMQCHADATHSALPESCYGSELSLILRVREKVAEELQSLHVRLLPYSTIKKALLGLLVTL